MDKHEEEPKKMISLVEEGDKELWGTDEETVVDDKEKQFCPLCAKYRPVEDIVSAGMGPVVLNICKKCNVMLHNLNVILGRAREKIRQKQKEEIAMMKESSKILTIPPLIVPGKN